MKLSQIKQLTAILLIGDGVLAAVNPRRDAEAWRFGPRPWKALMRYLSDYPALTRAIGIAEIGVGLAIIASKGSLSEQAAEAVDAAKAKIRSIA